LAIQSLGYPQEGLVGPSRIARLLNTRDGRLFHTGLLSEINLTKLSAFPYFAYLLSGFFLTALAEEASSES